MTPQQRQALKEKVAAKNAANGKPSPVHTVERPALPQGGSGCAKPKKSVRPAVY